MKAIELLYRAALEIEPERILIVNAEAHPLLLTIHAQSGHLDIQQHFKPLHAAIQHIGLTVSPNWPDSGNMYDLVLLSPSKNRQQTHAWMAEAMNRLPENGRMIVACANDHGAKSYASALEKLAGNIASRSKSKCRIFSARKEATYNSALATQWIAAALPRHVDSHGLITRPGLFSWDRPDRGSALLLSQLPALSGSGMDLCCGYGLLAEQILRRQDDITVIHLVEADRLALDCAIDNLKPWRRNILSHWADAASEPLAEQLDWVVCNPPFHSGQNRDVALGRHIAQRACQSLMRGGALFLVANRQLPYEQLLRSELRQCRCLVEADGFKVLEGVR